jgi:hypothetical protein
MLRVLSVCCSLKNPACNAHAPCCYPWPVPLYSIFQHYLTNGRIFGGKVLLNKICVLYIQLSSETFLTLKRIQRDIIITVHRSSCKESVVFVPF